VSAVPRLALMLAALLAAACGTSCSGGDRETDSPALRIEPLATRSQGPIAFIRGVVAPGRLVIIDPDGSNERTVAPPRRGYGIGGFSWSPDGQQILFVADAVASDPPAADLYVVDADGRSLRTLTGPFAEIEEFSWSPDGQRIVFTAATHDYLTGEDLYVIEADGGGLRRLTRTREDDEAPAWSPRGDTIAFDRHDDGYHAIWVINPDGSNARRLTPGTDFGDHAWSPDGTKIMYTDLDRHGGWFYVMNADGSAKHRVARALAPQWTPTSGQIAFGAGDDLWMVNPDGSGRRRAVEVGAEEWGFEFAPSGRTIVLATDTFLPDKELAVGDPAEGAVRWLTENRMHDSSPSWSPDERSLTFVRYRARRPHVAPGPGDIYVMNADGRGERNLTKSPADEYSPVWAPQRQPAVSKP
jgi:Tol biopolymer transport system component